MLINLILKHNLKKPLNKKFLIVPKPQNTSFQQIIFEKVLFAPAKAEVYQDKKFLNKFYYFPLDKAKNKTIYYIALLYFKKNTSYVKVDKHWLEKNNFINPSHPEVEKIAKNLKGKGDFEKIKSAFEFTVENLTYAFPIKGLYNTEEAIKVLKGKRKGVDCGGFSVFLISLLRSLKIPSRLAVGFLIKQKALRILKSLKIFPLTNNLLYMHAWVEVFSKEKGPVYLDPSAEYRKRKGLSKRPSFSRKPFDDRIVFSYGEDFTFKNFKIDILQNAIYL